MSNYNTCAVCNKEFGGRKKKYCSKECINANARERYRVKNNISSRKCQFCNRRFEPNKNGAKIKYCSEDCFKKMRRENNRERMRINYAGGSNELRTKRCEWCHSTYTVPGRNAHIARFCNSKCKDTWWSREVHGRKPIEEYTKERREQAEANKELAEREKVTKKIVKSLALAIKHKEEQEKIEALTRECEECGEVFYNPHPINKTCSPRCSKRRSNRMMKLYASKRINEHNLVDKGISLRKLYKRDKGVCYLCGNMCDKKDISITDEGYYIVGPAYPSVDHVKPLSKGGKHAWNNVKLAHHYCNTLKGDSQR